jgi:L-ascorbate metabolism protein UlaG (beta-lactamase superfamily)
MVHGASEAHRPGASQDRIVFLGHSTVLVEMDGVRLLTDPLLRGRVAHLRRQVAAVDRSVSADPGAVLVSHLHHDHLDLPSLRDLGRDTLLVVPAGAGAWLRRRGFTTVAEMSVGDTANVGALTVTAVPARHDGRRPLGVVRAVALGYLIQGRRTIYFAGDTEVFDGMAGPAPRLDVALLPVAGWAPKLGAGHMDPLDAARAAALLRPRVAIPIHWGTLLPIGIAARHRAALGDPPRLFAEHVARLAAGVRVCILAPGGETSL